MKEFRLVTCKTVLSEDIKAFIEVWNGTWIIGDGYTVGQIIVNDDFRFAIYGETSVERSDLLEDEINSINRRLGCVIQSAITVETPWLKKAPEGDFFKPFDAMVETWDAYLMEDKISYLDVLVKHLPESRTIRLAEWL